MKRQGGQRATGWWRATGCRPRVSIRRHWPSSTPNASGSWSCAPPKATSSRRRRRCWSALRVAMGGAAGARRAPACRPRHSACSMPASRRRRAGWSCARAECTNCRSAANPRFSTGKSRALDHASHAGVRLAPRAQPAARRLPGVRLHHCRRRIAGGLFAGGARSCRRTQCRRVAPALAEPDWFLARAAGRGVRRRRPASARTTARRTSAPCRRNTRGACSLSNSARVARRRNARAMQKQHRTTAGGARQLNTTRGAT